MELTERQQEILDLYRELRSCNAVATRLGFHHSTVKEHLDRVAAKGVILLPDNHDCAPVGHVSGKRTIQLDSEGNVEREWVRVHPEAESLRAITDMMTSRVAGKGKARKPRPINTDGSVVVFPIADPHIGLYCWREEVGDDYDLSIGVDLHVRAVAELASTFKRCARAVLAFLGDITHMDNRKQMTPQSGHLLDVDGRWAKVIVETKRMMCEMVEAAASICQEVDVVIVPGNHDQDTAFMFSVIMDAYYRNVPNVHVDVKPTKVKYLRHGKSLIGLAHGDKEKPQKLCSEMTLHPEWSASEWRGWYTGHIHTQRLHEFNHCTVESFATLAARDTYAVETLYRSRRQMVAIRHDPEYGEVDRRTISIKALKEATQ